MSKKFTKEEVNEKLKPKNIEVIEYNGYGPKKSKFKCLKCGYEWETKAGTILQLGCGCPNCYHKKQKDKVWTKEKFISSCKHPDDISIVGEYRGTNKKCKFKCLKCGYEWETYPNVYKRHGCPICNNNHPGKYTQETFEKKVQECHPDGDYEVLGTFKTINDKILVRHKTCGYEWETKAGNFIRQSKKFKPCGCPKCNGLIGESYGETLVSKYLTEHKYTFKQEYSFKDCRDKLPLPFDFAILNNNLIIATIEFDGEQHYKLDEESTIFTKEKMEILQTHDKIKTKYCESRKIPLLRIRYDDESYIDTLDSFFQEHSTTIESTSTDGSK